MIIQGSFYKVQNIAKAREVPMQADSPSYYLKCSP